MKCVCVWVDIVSIKKKYILMLLLSIFLLIPSVANANSTYTPKTLNKEETLIDVTVPLSLPVSVDSVGGVTVSNSVIIVNNTSGAIGVKGIRIEGSNGWSLTSFDKDYSSSKVGLKEFGFKLNGVEVEKTQILY